MRGNLIGSAVLRVKKKYHAPAISRLACFPAVSISGARTAFR